MAKRLIDLSQITNGKTLTAMLTSYAAEKVTTAIEKSKDAEGKVTNYTAEDLLEELKKSMVDLLGDTADTSIKKQIEDAIDEVDDREVKDYVSLLIPTFKSTDDVQLVKLSAESLEDFKQGRGNIEGITYDTENYAIPLSQDELKKFALDTPYPVYTFSTESALYNSVLTNARDTNTSYGNGKSLVNNNNEQIYLTLYKDTNDNDTIKAKFSDIPYADCITVKETKVVEEEATIGSDLQTLSLANKYITIDTGDTGDIFVWDANGKLLDKSEYYVRTLSGAVYFRKAQTEGATYKVTYWYKSIERSNWKMYESYAAEVNATTKLRTVLAWQVFPVQTTTFGNLSSDYLLDNAQYLEARLNNYISLLADELNSNEALIDAIVARCSEFAVEKVIDKTVNDVTNTLTTQINSVQNVVKNLQQEIVEEVTVTDKTVTIPLTYVPVSDREVTLFINGNYYRETTYFTVDRTTAAEEIYSPSITWLFTDTEGGFDLLNTFDIVIKYNKDMDKKVLADITGGSAASNENSSGGSTDDKTDPTGGTTTEGTTDGTTTA